jgi:hypothetical protein
MDNNAKTEKSGSSQSANSNSASTKTTEGTNKRKSFIDDYNVDECVAKIKAAFEPEAQIHLTTKAVENSKKIINESNGVSDDEEEPVVQGEGLNKKLVTKKPTK